VRLLERTPTKGKQREQTIPGSGGNKRLNDKRRRTESAQWRKKKGSQTHLIPLGGISKKSQSPHSDRHVEQNGRAIKSHTGKRVRSLRTERQNINASRRRKRKSRTEEWKGSGERRGRFKMKNNSVLVRGKMGTTRETAPFVSRKKKT